MLLSSYHFPPLSFSTFLHFPRRHQSYFFNSSSRKFGDERDVTIRDVTKVTNVTSRTSLAATASALIIALQYSLNLYCIDVSKAFTASSIDKPNVHMRVPDGLPTTHSDYAPHGSDTTWELLTTLYGLRQASSKYYEKFTNVLLAYTDSKGQSYRRSSHDPCVFTKGELGILMTTSLFQCMSTTNS